MNSHEDDSKFANVKYISNCLHGCSNNYFELGYYHLYPSFTFPARKIHRKKYITND